LTVASQETALIRNHRQNLIVLPGDGIGPEVIHEAVRVIEWFAKHRDFNCDVRHEEFGADSYRRTGVFIKEEVLADMMTVDAVLFGAMGGAIDADPVPPEIRRRFGLLRVRKEMGLFANLRPVKPIPALSDASTLRPEVTRGVDLVVVRELVGGIYFGEPRGLETLADGQRRGFNTQVYTTSEIRRIGKVAFELARKRSRRVTSVDKANVLESSALWREEMQALRDDEYRDVELNHLYVDNCSMQLIRAPRQFDVVVTDNIFGDILSDCAAMITGSLGMLPSASLSAPGPNGRQRAFYEPVHGSAPDIAGQGKANPLAAILSFGMALELSYGRRGDARLLDTAIDSVLAAKMRTGDIADAGSRVLSTSQMGGAVIDALNRLTR
jgi:3-isopropylmalate dehydrogenase